MKDDSSSPHEPVAARLPELPDRPGVGSWLVRWTLPITLVVLALLAALLSAVLALVPDEALAGIVDALLHRAETSGAGDG